MELKYSIIKKEVDNTHFYWVDDEFMPSVSRILDVAAPKEFGLLNFFKQNTPEDIEEISGKAKENGSLVHDACEKLLNGIEIPLKDYPLRAKKALLSFFEWYNTTSPKALITEQMVASKQFKYAGTLDLVCTIGGKRVLVDFKTNKGAIYKSNFWQLLAYKQAYEESTDERIDECWILRLGTSHKCGYEFKKCEEESFDDFLNIYKIYLSLNGGSVEKPPVIDVYPETLKLNL